MFFEEDLICCLQNRQIKSNNYNLKNCQTYECHIFLYRAENVRPCNTITLHRQTLYTIVTSTDCWEYLFRRIFWMSIKCRIVDHITQKCILLEKPANCKIEVFTQCAKWRGSKIFVKWCELHTILNMQSYFGLGTFKVIIRAVA